MKIKRISLLVISAAMAAVMTACSAGTSSSSSSSSGSSESSSPESGTESTVSLSSVESESDYEKAEFSSLKVVNDLGFTVTGLYLSPSHSKTWEENVLGDKTLPTGYSIDVSFPDGENARYWDIRVVGEGKQDVVWYEFDLLTVGTVDLVVSNGEMTAETYDR